MLFRTSQTFIGKRGQRFFSYLDKNQTSATFDMNLLRAFVNSTCMSIGGNSSKRTLLHITFAHSIVQWVQKEQHDNFRMDRIDFRMEIPLALTHGRLLNQHPRLNELCASASTLCQHEEWSEKKPSKGTEMSLVRSPFGLQFVVGKFNLKKPRSAQSWPAFVPKPEADSVIKVSKHPVLLPLEVQQCSIPVEQPVAWMRLIAHCLWRVVLMTLSEKKKVVVPGCMAVGPGKIDWSGCSTCGSHSWNQEVVLNYDWWRACHTMSQHFPGKNPVNFLATY